MLSESDKKTKKMYVFYMDKRETSISRYQHLSSCSKVMVVDQVGFTIKYDPGQEDQLNENTARRLLMFRGMVSDVIIAEDLEKAKAILKERYKEMMSAGGDKNPEQKAMWILDERTTEIQICPCLQINSKGVYSCGELEFDSGLFGDCFLEGSDQPEFCPVYFDEGHKMKIDEAKLKKAFLLS